jgi:predicted NUDIX family NTP pyrophosphohydrolase
MVQAMARKESAGTLLWRRYGGVLEVLIVHPSGAYNRKAPWSIPKGEVDPGEALEATARRETLEETGVTAGELVALGFIDYVKSKKRVHCFAGPAPAECDPRCASWEIDHAELVALDRAEELLHPDQRPFLTRLKAKLEVV